MVTAAVRLPVAVGLKVTLIVQLAPAARPVPQLFVWAKSPLFVPVIEIEFTGSDTAPQFVRVTTVAGLVVPTVRALKAIDVLESDTAVPVPVNVTTWGLPGSESVMISVPARANAAFGAKVTLTRQFAPAARAVPQVVVNAKSPGFAPPMAIPAMLSDVVPLLVTVTLLAALVVPIRRVAKVSDTGETVTAEIPVPVRATVWGLPAALSATASTADLAPRANGVNRTLTVQLEPAARLVPHVVVREKSPALAPASEIEAIVRTALPVLLTVTELAALVVPTRRLANVIAVGESVTVGATPVPVRATVCGLPAALSFTVTVAGRAPAAIGPNVTEIVQLAPAASVAGLSGQVEVRA